MAVYKSFAAASYESAAATAKQYLEDLNLFDSVTINGSTITLAYGGSTVGTIQYTSGRIDVTFGQFTFYAGDIGTFWIGKAKNGVLLDHRNVFVNADPYKMYTIAFFKSQSGTPMLVWHECGQSVQAGYAMTYDSPSAPTKSLESTLRSTSAYFSNLVGINTTFTGSETVATGSKVFQFIDRQTNVPYDSLSVINIAGTNYLTDGYVAVSDS